MTEKIDEISMVFPCDVERVPLFLNTLAKYQQWGIPSKVEIIVVSRTFTEMIIPGFKIKVIHYDYEGEYFCPSLALNLGVKNSQYKNVIISCPEVMPVNGVIPQLLTLNRGNYICRVFDLAKCGCKYSTLVTTGFRDETPGLYFLACYRKEDIEAINGWDMRFMNGYSNEDIDFGQRMINAGIPYCVRDDIMGEHQWHARGDAKDNPGFEANKKLYEENKESGATYVENGINQANNEQE